MSIKFNWLSDDEIEDLMLIRDTDSTKDGLLHRDLNGGYYFSDKDFTKLSGPYETHIQVSDALKLFGKSK